MSKELADAILLGLPALTENGSPAVANGSVYWRPLLGGEGVDTVDVAE